MELPDAEPWLRKIVAARPEPEPASAHGRFTPVIHPATLRRWAAKTLAAIDFLIDCPNWWAGLPDRWEVEPQVPPTFGKVKLKRPLG